MKDKSLEQLVQHLRKALHKESLPYLNELVLRTQASYLQAAVELESESRPAGGIHKPSDLQHIEQGSLLIASIKQDGTSSYVVARKSWIGDGTRIHLLNEDREEIAPNLVEYFIPVASSYGTLTRDALIVQAKEYRRQITYMQEANRLQNIELDALGYVWCTGNCNGGQFWHTEPQEITSEMISAVIGVTMRLAERGRNTSNDRLAQQLKYFNELRGRRIAYFEKHKGLEQRVKDHHLKLMAFKEAVAVPPDAAPTDVAPTEQKPSVFKSHLQHLLDYENQWYILVAVSLCAAIWWLLPIVWNALCPK